MVERGKLVRPHVNMDCDTKRIILSEKLHKDNIGLGLEVLHLQPELDWNGLNQSFHWFQNGLASGEIFIDAPQ